MKVVIVGGVAGGESCAARVLLQHGFKARNLSGGYLSRAIRSEDFAAAATPRTT